MTDRIKKTMENCKHVVTSNKKMVATNLQELLDLQRKHNVGLLYEGCACGSIPIIRTLEEYFDNEDLIQVTGIFNGTTNYILSKTVLTSPLGPTMSKLLSFSTSNSTLFKIICS